MSLSLGIWLCVVLAKALALAATWRPNLDRGLVCLRWYLLFSLSADFGEFITLHDFGYRSLEYRYTYYLADLAVVILGFLVLVRLVELAFEHTSLRLQDLRTVAIVLFSGVAVCSGTIVYLLRGGLATGSLAEEMEQNFSFLGMILAIILFVGLNVMQVSGVRFRRIVLSFSLLYSGSAIVYSLTATLPSLFRTAFSYMVPFTTLAGIVLIAYALLVPEPQRGAQKMRAAPRLASVSEATW